MSQKAGRAITRYIRDASGNVMAVYQNNVLTERPIYGSSRLGQLDSASAPGYRRVGLKRYELSNHLGNVLAVVSDRIRMKTDSTWTQVLSRTDYYPFGLEMTGRTESATYRYGFNGMEGDDELKGPKRSYTTEFRQYDPIVGRWWSVDPAKYVGSPYAGFGNNPIIYVDPRGDTIRFANDVDAEFRSTALSAMDRIKTTEIGAKILGRLESSKDDYFITQVGHPLSSGFEANRVDNSDPNSPFTSGGTIYLGLGVAKGDGVNFNTPYVLGHELFHAYQRDLGVLGFEALIETKSDNGYVNLAEVQAVGFENYLRASFAETGYNKVRKTYTTKGVLGRVQAFELKEYTYTKGWPHIGLGIRESWALDDFIKYKNVWLHAIRDKALIFGTK